MTRFFHILSDGETVKEISKDAYYKILRQDAYRTLNHRMIARVYKSNRKDSPIEIAIRKGKNYIYLRMTQITKINECMRQIGEIA